LNNFSVDAAPPASASFFASFARFWFRRVPRPTALLALFNGCLTDLPVFAAPNWMMVNDRTIPPRFGFGWVPMTAALVAIRPGHRDDAHAVGSINAAPTQTSATISRGCFLRIVTFAAPPLAFLFGRLEGWRNDRSLDAAPTQLAVGVRF